VARSCRLLLVAFLAACADLVPVGDSSPLHAAQRVRLADVEADEVVIVINNNAAGGRHSGMFAGRELSDPSGSYLFQRSGTPGWPGASLDDYVAFQLEDGANVRVYRFRLQASDFAEIERRIRGTGVTPPLFCAVAVQNQIAGVGPFAGIEETGWTSPSALARRLDPLVGSPVAGGTCLRPSGSLC
jgi:hypothetical protein